MSVREAAEHGPTGRSLPGLPRRRPTSASRQLVERVFLADGVGVDVQAPHVVILPAAGGSDGARPQGARRGRGRARKTPTPPRPRRCGSASQQAPSRVSSGDTGRRLPVASSHIHDFQVLAGGARRGRLVLRWRVGLVPGGAEQPYCRQYTHTAAVAAGSARSSARVSCSGSPPALLTRRGLAPAPSALLQLVAQRLRGAGRAYDRSNRRWTSGRRPWDPRPRALQARGASAGLRVPTGGRASAAMTTRRKRESCGIRRGPRPRSCRSAAAA